VVPPAVAGILTQVAVITALMCYFGWARTQAMFGYFGIDVGWLGYSTFDFVMRSIDSTFAPLLIACMAIIVLTYAHAGLLRLGAGRNQERIRWAAVVLRGAAAACCLTLAAGLMFTPFADVATDWLPLTVPVAAAALVYADYLMTAIAGRGRGSRSRSAALIAIFLVGAFWTIASYATTVGTNLAERFVHDLPTKPDIVLYSTQRLTLSGPGVAVVELPQEGNRYKFRYDGLRILAHTKDRYVLLPADWQQGRDHAFFLPDDDKIRIDIFTWTRGS